MQQPSIGALPCRATAANIARTRAAYLAHIRAFFNERGANGAIEADVSGLSAYAPSDAHTHTLRVIGEHFTGFLTPSPEYALKSWMAKTSIYDAFYLGPAWRDDAASPKHTPQFTMLEWYRPHDWRAVVHEAFDLIQSIAANIRCDTYTPNATAALATATPYWLSYDELLHQATNIPYAELSDLGVYAPYCKAKGIAVQGIGVDDSELWQQLVWTHCAEPLLKPYPLAVIYDYPKHAAILAETGSPEPSNPCFAYTQQPVAKRFELYVSGTELANGWQECNDAAILAARFDQDNAARMKAGHDARAPDPALLAAVRHLPAMSGIALGADRLLAHLLGEPNIAHIQASFPDKPHTNYLNIKGKV